MKSQTSILKISERICCIVLICKMSNKVKDKLILTLINVTKFEFNLMSYFIKVYDLFL